MPISLMGRQYASPLSSICLSSRSSPLNAGTRVVDETYLESAKVVERGMCRKECITLFICIDLVPSGPTCLCTE